MAQRCVSLIHLHRSSEHRVVDVAERPHGNCREVDAVDNQHAVDAAVQNCHAAVVAVQLLQCIDFHVSSSQQTTNTDQ